MTSKFWSFLRKSWHFLRKLRIQHNRFISIKNQINEVLRLLYTTHDLETFRMMYGHPFLYRNKQYLRSEDGQEKYICDFFGHRTGGFFVELGAYDGIKCSNTYYLEKVLDWKGILIEPNVEFYKKIDQHRYKHIAKYNCAVHSSKQTVLILEKGLESRVIDNNNPVDSSTEHQLSEVPAKRLESILEEQGINTVDFFSLDTEHTELDVLNSIDFDKVTIGLFCIEIHINSPLTPINKFENIHTFLASKGYVFLIRLHRDCFFAHSSYLKKYNKPTSHTVL